MDSNSYGEIKIFLNFCGKRIIYFLGPLSVTCVNQDAILNQSTDLRTLLIFSITVASVRQIFFILKLIRIN